MKQASKMLVICTWILSYRALLVGMANEISKKYTHKLKHADITQGTTESRVPRLYVHTIKSKCTGLVMALLILLCLE